MSRQGIVYGDDDREEPFGSGQPGWVTEAVSSRLLALGPVARISRGPSGQVVIDAKTLQQRLDICEGEAFANQPSFADCSGVIMSSRYVLTAAHCTRVAPLSQQVGVGRFYYEASGALHAVEPSDLHAFTRVVAWDDFWDYAWLELAESVGERATEVLGTVTSGDDLLSLSHGAGLPAKVARSVAAEVDESAFLSTLDAFGGSSGGPVFSASGALLGILTGGAPDYEVTTSGCHTAAHRPDAPGSAAEIAVRIDFALKGFCAVSEDPELCAPSVGPPPDAGCSMSPGPVGSPQDVSLVLGPLGQLLLLVHVRRRRSARAPASQQRCRRTSRQTDRQTDRQVDRQTGRQADR